MRGLFSLLLAGMLAGCAHVTNSGQALCSKAATGGGCDYDPLHGYRFKPHKRKDGDTLVVVTFSGGGVRATALAYGTLLALRDLKAIDTGNSLLDDVDIVSSVSGGSVAAGWYAYQGQAGLAPGNKLDGFIHQGATSQLAERGLNPVALGSYLFTPATRSDVLADEFASRLFNDATFADIDAAYSRQGQPFIILNASDIGHETRFPFTQNRFDLICSDLNRYRLSNAVAASADFPLVFSPMGVTNYSYGGRCPFDQATNADYRAKGPPAWIDSPAVVKYDDPAALQAAQPIPSTNALLELRQARNARDFETPQAGDGELHLLDGGLVDNLGIQSPLALEDDPACPPGLFQRLAAPRPPAYQYVKRVVFIVVNARSRDPTKIDGAVYPPGEIGSLHRSIDTPLDSSILDMQNYLTAELEAIQSWKPSFATRPKTASELGTCWTDWREQKARAENVAAASGRSSVSSPLAKEDAPGGAGGDEPAEKPIDFRVVSVDFELIPTVPCRRKFWTMATTWTLKPAEIDDLIRLPRLLFARSNDLKNVYRDMTNDRGTSWDGDVWRQGTELKGAAGEFSSVCS
jgi:NTE family protein